MADLNRDIQRLFFPRRKLYGYSSDRNYIVSVVDKIIFSNQKVKDRFNQIIHEKFAQLRKPDGTLKYDEFLLFCDPEEICEAAITSIENEK